MYLSLPKDSPFHLCRAQVAPAKARRGEMKGRIKKQKEIIKNIIDN